MNILDNIKIKSIEGGYNNWTITVTATVSGVQHEGFYSVGSDSVDERWFEPVGAGSSLTEADDEDFYVITDGVTVATVSSNDFCDSSAAARLYVQDAVNLIELEISNYTYDVIRRLIA